MTIWLICLATHKGMTTPSSSTAAVAATTMTAAAACAPGMVLESVQFRLHRVASSSIPSPTVAPAAGETKKPSSCDCSNTNGHDGGIQLPSLSLLVMNALQSMDAFDNTDVPPYWATIWPSAYILTSIFHHLCYCHQSPSPAATTETKIASSSYDIARKRILDLGSGTGVTGIAMVILQRQQLALAGQQKSSMMESDEGGSVTMVDYSSHATQLAIHNAQLNGITITPRAVTSATPPASLSSNVRALQLDWNDLATWPSDAYDLVLGGDVLYSTGSARAIATLLTRIFARPSSSGTGNSRVSTALFALNGDGRSTAEVANQIAAFTTEPSLRHHVHDAVYFYDDEHQLHWSRIIEVTNSPQWDTQLHQLLIDTCRSCCRLFVHHHDVHGHKE